jgi:hypothetical protein
LLICFHKNNIVRILWNFEKNSFGSEFHVKMENLDRWSPQFKFVAASGNVIYIG